ncbi:MAG: transglycosylase family protein [Streptosporangiales bacterium]
MGGSRALDVHDRRIMLSSKRTHNRRFSVRTVSVAGGVIAAAALASGAAASAATTAGATGQATTSTAAAPVKLAATVHQDVRFSGAHRRVNARPSTYTVKPGDSLYGITGRLFGNAALWPRFYAANLKVVGADPGQITAGERLTVRLARHGETGQVVSVQQAPAVTEPGSTVSAPVAAPVAAAAAYGGSAPGGSFGSCVRAHESGGNYQAYNPGGYYGAYQFSASTWAAYGGNPADYGHASPGEQDQVFANALAQGGQSNWAPYDGC